MDMTHQKPETGVSSCRAAGAGRGSASRLEGLDTQGYQKKITLEQVV